MPKRMLRTGQFTRIFTPVELSIESSGMPKTGRVFYVDSNTGADADGRGTFDAPFDSIDYAIGKCVASKGDVIYVMPGHAETLTAKIALDVAGVSLIGLGVGRNRPAITVGGVIDGIDVTAANCRVSNFYFPAATAAATARINIDAADVEVDHCYFLCGANDLLSITITANGLRAYVHDNEAVVSANGPDAMVQIESASAVSVKIYNNSGDGQSDTNAWDLGFIYSTVAHLRCEIIGNVNNFGPAIIFTAAATGVIAYNVMGEGTLGSMLDPGSCMCFQNYEADDIDQTARLFPTTAAS